MWSNGSRRAGSWRARRAAGCWVGGGTRWSAGYGFLRGVTCGCVRAGRGVGGAGARMCCFSAQPTGTHKPSQARSCRLLCRSNDHSWNLQAQLCRLLCRSNDMVPGQPAAKDDGHQRDAEPGVRRNQKDALTRPGTSSQHSSRELADSGQCPRGACQVTPAAADAAAKERQNACQHQHLSAPARTAAGPSRR
jgi:hypothetical protein